MSLSMNRVTLIGRLGADPDVRHTQDGKMIVNLRVATGDVWKDKVTGERRERTEWHRVVVFSEPMAKFAQQYLRKGGRVFAEGQIQTRKWQDQGGQERYTTEIVIQPYSGNLISLDGQSQGGRDRDFHDSSPSAGYGSDYDAGPGPHGGGDFGSSSLDDDEIPF